MIFEIDTSVTSPTLTVVAVGPFPVAQVTRGLIAQNGNAVEILDVRGSREIASLLWHSGLRAFAAKLHEPISVLYFAFG